MPEEFQATPCDFFGYTSTGRAIMVEAKMVNRPSLPIGCDPGLKPHQWNALEEANRANCLALLCWSRGDTCAVLSIDMVLELSKDRRSIPWEKIEKRFLHSMSGSSAALEILEPFLSAKTS